MMQSERNLQLRLLSVQWSSSALLLVFSFLFIYLFWNIFWGSSLMSYNWLFESDEALFPPAGFLSWISKLHAEWIGSGVSVGLPSQTCAKERERRRRRVVVDADRSCYQQKTGSERVVCASFIPRPLSHAWLQLSNYLSILRDAWSRMRCFVPALLYTHTDTHYT